MSSFMGSRSQEDRESLKRPATAAELQLSSTTEEEEESEDPFCLPMVKELILCRAPTDSRLYLRDANADNSGRIKSMQQCRTLMEGVDCVSVSTQTLPACYQMEMNKDVLSSNGASHNMTCDYVTSLIIPFSHITLPMMSGLVHHFPRVSTLTNSDSTADAVIDERVMLQVPRFEYLRIVDMGTGSLLAGRSMFDILCDSIKMIPDASGIHTLIHGGMLTHGGDVVGSHMPEMHHIILTALERGNTGVMFVAKISKLLVICSRLMKLTVDNWDLIEDDTSAASGDCPGAEGHAARILDADNRRVLRPALPPSAKAFLQAFIHVPRQGAAAAAVAVAAAAAAAADGATD